MSAAVEVATTVTPPPGWIAGRDGVHYPPEPWRLAGDFAISVFLFPRGALPPDVDAHVPAGAHILRVGSRVIVGAVAVRYDGDSVLTYDELMIAVPVWHRRRLRVSIAQIWVTSAASVAGGRELWGIPKHLMSATRTASHGRLSAAYLDAAGTPLATVDAEDRGRLPGRWPLPLPTAQRLPEEGHEDRVSRNGLTAGIHRIRAHWRFGGPLSWLADARPVLSVGLGRAVIVFGA